MKKTKTIENNSALVWINIAFTGVAVLLLFYYVVMANAVTASSYKAKTLQARIDSLSEVNSLLMSKKLSMEIPAVLTEFARAQNLVEAKDVVYIFENKNVARR